MGGGRGISPRTLSQGRRGRDPRHRLPGSLRRQLRRRSVRQGGGQRRAHALRFRRLGRRVGIAGYRLASGGQVGPSRGARAGSAGGAARREDHGPGGHRALWRLRRGQPEDPCGARWRSLSRQRQQDLHHQRRARGLLHGGGAYRRRGFRRHQPAAGGEGHCRVQCRPQAEEDGLVGVGYRRTVLRRLPGACGNLIGVENAASPASWPISRASAWPWR